MIWDDFAMMCLVERKQQNKYSMHVLNIEIENLREMQNKRLSLARARGHATTASDICAYSVCCVFSSYRTSLNS